MWTGSSTPGERLEDVDHPFFVHRLGESRPISNLRAIDEDRHVLSEAALLVEDIPAGARVLLEVGVYAAADSSAAAHGRLWPFRSGRQRRASKVASSEDGAARTRTSLRTRSADVALLRRRLGPSLCDTNV
jgi:hypothetical protein